MSTVVSKKVSTYNPKELSEMKYTFFRKIAAITCEFNNDSFSLHVRPEFASYRDKAVEVSSSVLETNRQISKGKVKELIWTEVPITHDFALLDFKAIFTDTTKLEAPEIAKKIIFHECAHIFYHYGITRRDDKQFGMLYVQLMKSIGSKTNHSSCQKTYEKRVEDPRLSLFHESNYRGMCDGGHIDDGRHELFASLSNILKSAPNEFMKRLGAFEKTYADFHRLAMTTVALTSKLWHPAEVLPTIITDLFESS